MSNDADVNAEIAGLQAAKRRACVRVLESDVSKGIVVMERLVRPSLKVASPFNRRYRKSPAPYKKAGRRIPTDKI